MYVLPDFKWAKNCPFLTTPHETLITLLRLVRLFDFILLIYEREMKYLHTFLDPKAEEDKLQPSVENKTQQNNFYFIFLASFTRQNDVKRLTVWSSLYY